MSDLGDGECERGGWGGGGGLRCEKDLCWKFRYVILGV